VEDKERMKRSKQTRRAVSGQSRLILVLTRKGEQMVNLGDSLQSGKVVQWTVFDNKKLLKKVLGNWFLVVG
jgi:hypothetical protein